MTSFDDETRRAGPHCCHFFSNKRCFNIWIYMWVYIYFTLNKYFLVFSDSHYVALFFFFHSSASIPGPLNVGFEGSSYGTPYHSFEIYMTSYIWGTTYTFQAPGTIRMNTTNPWDRHVPWVHTATHHLSLVWPNPAYAPLGPSYPNLSIRLPLPEGSEIQHGAHRTASHLVCFGIC